MRVVRGDITTIAVDAIVNAADPALLGGHGVDGAIHRAAGPRLLAECKQLMAQRGPAAAGEALITSAGDLPAQYVIHVVAPVWAEWKQWDGQADRQLGDCYRNALALGQRHGVHSISFPNIGTGHFGFPKERAAKLAILATQHALENATSINEVLFVCFDSENADIYEQLLGQDRT